ncbi:hypothetical protein [Argonema antarcticum]|uniref:hypothetical protein n=1 Tax=Argonema antarcticum TaxID=2942763 RepID=UPI0020136FD7|nr:hypothetical protein [Argonema antarcticum]MCL1469331.1 hypothetical protein [Argonema antarcticum A004/B2]
MAPSLLKVTKSSSPQRRQTSSKDISQSSSSQVNVEPSERYLSGNSGIRKSAKNQH